MSHAPPIPPNAPARDDLAWDLAMLRDLAESGMKLAKTFAKCTQDAAEAGWIDLDSKADPGKPFANMARCVRQTLALRARFIKQQRTAHTPETPERDDRAARAWRAKRKSLVRGAIEEFIHTTADRGDAERLLSDMDECLDDEEATDDFDTRPIGRIVLALCDVLGVKFNENLFCDEELGILAFDPDLPRNTDPYVLGRQLPDSRFREQKRPHSRGPTRPGGTDPLAKPPRPPPRKIDPSPD